MRMSRPVSGLAAVSVLLLSGALSGCGVAGTSFHPGVAAQVGDATVTTARVDSLASTYCSAVEDKLKAQSQALPNSYFRAGLAGQLALVSVAEQLADQYDVEPGAAYAQKVAQLRAATASLPKDQQDAVVEIESAPAYLAGVQQAIGERLQSSQGTTGDAAAQTKAGQRVFDAWFTDHDVTIDPQYGVEIKDGRAVPTDTSVSYPVGSAATSGAAPQPDPSYAASLPDSQRCG